MSGGGLIGDGLLLMILGMSVVFVFLTLLYGATFLLTRVVAFFPEPATDPLKKSAKPAVASTAKAGEVVAAISAAISTHRRSK